MEFLVFTGAAWLDVHLISSRGTHKLFLTNFNGSQEYFKHTVPLQLHIFVLNKLFCQVVNLTMVNGIELKMIINLGAIDSLPN